MESKNMLTTRECRYQRVQEFKDWDHSFLYKNLTDAKKFKVNYTDEFVKSVDAKILISKEYIIIKRRSRPKCDDDSGTGYDKIDDEIREFEETELKSMIVIPLTLILNIKFSGSDGFYDVEFTLRYSNKFSITFCEEYQDVASKFENCIKSMITLIKGVKETISRSWVTKYKRIFLGNEQKMAKDIVKEDIAQYIKYLSTLLKMANKDQDFTCKGNIDIIGSGKKKRYESKICETYPQFLFVPKSITLNQLQTVMKFRTKNRIPALCYLHVSRNGGSLNLSALWRSGQIKTGLTGSRKAEDEKFVSEIGRLTHFNGHERVTVFDCRPWKNAAANMFAGKGYISTKYYNLNEIIFGNIDNIHVMRSAYNSVHSSFFKGSSMVAIGEWYEHIKKLLEGAQKCSELISKGNTVIVNCSDGWDRTPQTTSLTKILLNKRFRTFNGFKRLVNYEFIGFGHKFQDRQMYEDNKESSPIFIQFLDAVYQVLNQNQNDFEFNSLFLKDLALAHGENRFQEFAHNKFIDLVKNELDGLSVWIWLEKRKKYHINPNYKYQKFDFTNEIFAEEVEEEPLVIETHPFYLKFWNEFHMSSIEKSLKITKHDKDLQKQYHLRLITSIERSNNIPSMDFILNKNINFRNAE